MMEGVYFYKLVRDIEDLRRSRERDANQFDIISRGFIPSKYPALVGFTKYDERDNNPERRPGIYSVVAPRSRSKLLLYPNKYNGLTKLDKKSYYLTHREQVEGVISDVIGSTDYKLMLNESQRYVSIACDSLRTVLNTLGHEEFPLIIELIESMRFSKQYGAVGSRVFVVLTRIMARFLRDEYKKIRNDDEVPKKKKKNKHFSKKLNDDLTVRKNEGIITPKVALRAVRHPKWDDIRPIAKKIKDHLGLILD